MNSINNTINNLFSSPPKEDKNEDKSSVAERIYEKLTPSSQFGYQPLEKDETKKISFHSNGSPHTLGR